MAGQTLLVGLAHPDDEVGAVGAIMAQRARGDRVVVVWLTKGEMTEAFGAIPQSEVARIRVEHGRQAGEILGVETRFMDFPDTGLAPTPEAAREVARLIVDVKPDAVLTWGDAWGRGMRHPDHQACGKIFRDAVTLARIAKVIAPAAPHRALAPVFTYRGAHSTLPAVVLDVEPYLPKILELAQFYYERIKFGEPGWIAARLATAGAPYGLRHAEVYDAWESAGGIVPSLLPAIPAPDDPTHPEREEQV
jgi:LmbE family N-acetylglucosaminyl deacetylase